MKRLRSVLLVVDGQGAKSLAEAERLRHWLGAREVAVELCDAASISREPSADLALVLGGDGTFLRAARSLQHVAIPLIGVRLGSFGYLAELEPGSWEPELERLLAGEGVLESWMRLRAEILGPERQLDLGFALNEVLVTAASIGRLLVINIRIDGENVSRFRGDGMVVATPVGSTAHSLAAGGPIIERAERSLLLTPLNSQALTFRPLVLGENRVVELVVVVPRHGAAVTLDGQETVELSQGEVVRVRAAERDLLVASVVKRSQIRTLRERLHWGAPLLPE